jgi:acyl carrier protein
MTVEELVKKHIETELLWDRKIDLDLDTNLTQIVDSAGILSLAIWIESTFDFSIEIDRLAADDFASIRRLAAWIRTNAPDGNAERAGRVAGEEEEKER